MKREILIAMSSALLFGGVLAGPRAHADTDQNDETVPDRETESVGLRPASGSDATAENGPLRLSNLAVTGQPARLGAPASILPNLAGDNAVDTTALLRGAPGANYVNNGPLSGQVQYRGMFGDRVGVRIDGVPIVPGGPNWMDAPLHYAPRQQLESLNIYRGIAPVSAGAETIGGAVVAETRQSRFTGQPDFSSRGRVSGGFQANGSVTTLGGYTEAANRSHRFHALANYIDGDDRDFDSANDLEIAGTRTEKVDFGIGYGVRIGKHQFSADYRRHETDDTGNPSLPADIRFIDTDIVKAAYEGNFNEVEVSAQFHYQGVDHVMTNFDLRPAPDFFTPPAGAPMPVQVAFGGLDRRLLDVTSDTFGAEASARLPLAGGRLELGFDVLTNEHSTDVSDPDSPFFVQPFNEVERDRYSGFAEWSGSLRPALELLTGVRVSRVDTDAATVIAPPLPPAQILKDRFNAADRSQNDTLFDWAVQLEQPFNDMVSARLGGARKTRAPSYIERYAWIPIEATAGFADGNNHVGQLGLDPEVAHEINLGFDIRTEQFRLSPQVFYRDIDDYIQGIPATDPAIIMVSTVNGDPTPLQYSNVGAEFYGADADFGYVFDQTWRLDGTVSYVRAKRTDIDDDIFRVAPLNGDLSLTYSANRWRVLARSVWAADQSRVSSTNGEPESDGYVILNLTAEADLTSNLVLRAGIGNVFDNRYRDHLAGFNRIISSDVPGEPAPPATKANRIPGLGRNLYVRMDVTW